MLINWYQNLLVPPIELLLMIATKNSIKYCQYYIESCGDRRFRSEDLWLRVELRVGLKKVIV